MRWIEALVLGLVQGVTEFLPISSDGHLSISEQALAWWSGVRHTGSENLFFFVMLHLGTLAAILVHYRREGLEGAKGLLGKSTNSPEFDRNSVIKAGLLACVATLPAIPVGLFLKKPLEAAFESPIAAPLGFLVTALAIGSTFYLKGGKRGLAGTTWWHALLIGSAQAIAILPGVSRSGMTIMTALTLGFTRTWAVGFSLLMAIPAILGAAVLELKDVEKSMIAPDRIGPILLGVVAAGLVGYLAIVWLVRVVQSGRMWYFSVYLVILSACLLGLHFLNKGKTNGPRTARAERSLLVEPPAQGPSTFPEPRSRGLDRPQRARQATNARLDRASPADGLLRI